MGLPPSYQYPSVHPPAMQYHYQNQDHLVKPKQNPRYSWMDPPAEHPDDKYLSNTTCGQSNVSNCIQNSDVKSKEQQYQEPIKEQEELNMLRTTTPQSQESKLAKTQPMQQRTTEAAPLPVKERYKHYNPDQKVHIGPDENPLTPGSPPPVTHFPGKFVNSPAANTMGMNFSPPLKQASNPEPFRGGSWQHGLCSCVEPTICMSAIFCPCIVYGRTQYKLNLRSEHKDPSNMLGYSAVNGSCATWTVLCGVNILLSAIQHTRVRKAYSMDSEAGNVATDCLKSVCCCCCMLAQDEKEVNYREELGRKRNQRASVGYVPPASMTYNLPP